MIPPFRKRGAKLSLFCAWSIASACAADAGLGSHADGLVPGLLIRVQGVSAVTKLELELEEQVPGSCDQTCQWTALAPVLLPLTEEGAGRMKGNLSGLSEGTYRMQASASPAPGRTFATADWVEVQVGPGPTPTLFLLLYESRAVVEGEEAVIPHFVSVLLDESSVGPSETITFTVQAGGGEGLLSLSGVNGTPLPQAGTNCPPGGCATGSFGSSPAPFDPTQGSVPIAWTAPAATGDYVHPLLLQLKDEAGRVSKILVEVEVGSPQGPSIKYLPPSFGMHACFIGSDDEVYCWGANTDAQAGIQYLVSADQKILVPTKMTDSFPEKKIALEVHPSADTNATTSGVATCALLENGKVACWGDHYRGRLGDGADSLAKIHTPQYVRDETTSPESDLEGVAALAIGKSTSCALLSGANAGKVKCWGEGATGALGNGQISTSPYRKATWVLTGSGGAHLDGVTSLVAGNEHVCAVKGPDQVVCWGAGTQGQLGDGKKTKSYYPVSVSGLSGVTITQIAAGGNNTCVLLSDKTLRCWGYNTNGQMGNGTSGSSHQSTPAAVSDLTDVEGVTVGYQHICAWTTEGSGKCWGYNGYCQSEYYAGACTGVTNNKPATVVSDSAKTPLTGILKMIAGSDFTCALRTDGGMKCWGYGFYGAVGNNSVVSPVRLPTNVSLPWQP